MMILMHFSNNYNNKPHFSTFHTALKHVHHRYGAITNLNYHHMLTPQKKLENKPQTQRNNTEIHNNHHKKPQQLTYHFQHESNPTSYVHIKFKPHPIQNPMRLRRTQTNQPLHFHNFPD
ncbi:hypothetical protein GYH30_006337 [Glycine max]|uniref:Uncharacterized protein n=1 Tax=Glycine max TaxID=3847 RepID=K7KD44_SOYBN|nr:hypothetical protein GYH30_006337 [Glycine max]